MDADALFDALVDHGVLEVDPETDAVSLSKEFDHTLSVYEDTYTSVSTEEYHSSVADVFGLPDADQAAELIEREGVSRVQLSAFLALRSELPSGEFDRAELATMAQMVVELEPSSPVPDSLTELTDDSYGEFLADHPDAVVTLWKLRCEPCESQKSVLDEIIADAPDVAFAGLDGEAAREFCTEFDVNAAPAFVLFRDGELVEAFTGYQRPEPLLNTLRDVY